MGRAVGCTQSRLASFWALGAERAEVEPRNPRRQLGGTRRGGIVMATATSQMVRLIREGSWKSHDQSGR